MRRHLSKIYFALAITAIVFIVSCNSPLDKKFSDKTFRSDVDNIMKKEKVDSIDMGMMAMYIATAKMRGDKVEEQTYRTILDSAREMHKKIGNFGQGMMPAPPPTK